MVKKNLGRKQQKVIESSPYDEIIFIVASGYNYALKIAEIREKKDSSPTAKQLKQLEERGFLKSSKEKLLNKTIYEVNWNKIAQEFAKYLLEIVMKRDQQLKAYYGGDYNNYIKRQEQDLKKINEGISKRKSGREYNEEKAYKNLKELIKSKRLNKNKYLHNLFKIIFNDYFKVYVKNKISVTIKDLFEEIKQSFGLENFGDYVWTKMLAIVYYKEPFPHINKRLKPGKTPLEQIEEDNERLKELEKRYNKLKQDKDFQDIIIVETALRFAGKGYLVPQASWKYAHKIIKEMNLITPQEFEEYEKLNNLNTKENKK